MSRHYYLGPWVWDDSDPSGQFYRAPDGTVGLIDLRPVTPTLDYGFFALSDDRDLGGDYTEFGDGINRLEDVSLSPSQRSLWSSMLNIGAISGNRLVDALWETLTVQADPDGATHAKPIMPTRLGQMELHLGGHSLIRAERFNGIDHPAYGKVQAVIQNGYAGIRTHGQSEAAMLRTQNERPIPQRQTPRYPIWARINAMKDRTGTDWATARDLCAAESDIIHSKYLWCMAAKTRIPWQNLIPGGLPQDPPRRPSTTFTETWPTDGTDITTGQDQTWSIVDGGWLVSGGKIRTVSTPAGSFAQCATDLSSTDHYAKTSLYPATTMTNAPVARCSGAAITGYLSIFRSGAPGTDKRSYKVVSGFYTQLGSTSSGAPSSGDTGQCRANGSNISLYYNGSEIIGPTTDTAITTGTRCGIWGYGSDRGDLGNFEAADLVATSGISHPLSGPFKGPLGGPFG